MSWTDAVYGPPKGSGGFSVSRPTFKQTPFTSWGGSSGWASAAPPKAKGYSPPAFPAGLNVVEPWSSRSTQPPPPQKNTQWNGDPVGLPGSVLGSFGAAMGNAVGGGGYLNFGNAIPWAEERSFVAAKTLADTISGQTSSKQKPNDFLGNLGGVAVELSRGNVGGAIDNFAGAVKSIAEPVSAAFSAVPNFVTNTRLNGAAEQYRDLTLGKPLDVFAELPWPLGSKGTPNVNILGFNVFGGDSRQDPSQTQRDIQKGMIDIAPSVKKAIEGNPNGDLAKYLDDAPEGRQFSYLPGLEGTATNLLMGVILYGGELKAVGALAAAAAGPALGATPMTLGADATLGAAGRALAARGLQTVAASRGVQAAATGVSVLAKAQKLMLASGISYFGANVVVDTVLRVMGDTAGVAYLDQINRTALVSDSPAVQLVSAFGVDPIGSGKAAVRGELKLLGLPAVAFDKTAAELIGSKTPALSAIGRRLTKLYTSDTATLDRMGQMYGVDRKAAVDMVGPGRTYETMTDAHDQVLGLAANAMADNLPAAEKMLVNALPDTVRTNVLLGKRYIDRVLAEYDKATGLVAQFRRDWSNHDFYGNFDPNIAQLVTRAFRDAMKKTVAARERINAVVGRVDLLNPEGQGLVAGKIDAMFADGRQGTLRDLNSLSAEHPSMDGLVKQEVATGTNGKPFVKPLDAVPREVFDTALQRATDEYNAVKVSNPVRAATGADPVLRPGVHQSDWAAAFNTDEATIGAITSAGKRTSAQDSLIATFLRDKNLATGTELATLPADELFVKALDHLNTVSAPWVKRGADVDLLEAEIGKAAAVEKGLRDRRTAGESIGNQEIKAAEADMGRLQGLMGDVRDPITTMVERLKSSLGAEGAVMRAARRKVDAMGRLEEIRAVRDTLAPAQALAFGDLLRSVKQVRGEWRWAADERVQGGPVFDAAVARYKTFQFETRAWTRNAAMKFDGTPPAGQAAEMAASKGFAKTLVNRDQMALGQDVTNGEIADMVASDRTATETATEITPGMREALGFKATGEEGRADFIARVGSLREAFDTALSGKTEAVLGRAAKVTVKDWAVQRVLKGEVARLFNDPIAEGNYANALNDLKAALDSDAFAAVRPVVEGDPILRAQARELVAREGVAPSAAPRGVTSGPADVQAAFHDIAVSTPAKSFLGVEVSPSGMPNAIERIEGANPVGKTVGYIARDASGNDAGLLILSLDDAGKIDGVLDVSVRPDAQRMGVASRLYGRAERDGFDIRSVSGRATTPAGAAFSTAYKSRPSVVRPGGVHGWGLGDYLTNPANKESIRNLLPTEMPVRDIPGVPHADTARAQAILAGDETALPELKSAIEAVRAKLGAPLKDVPAADVDAIASAPRLSVTLADDLNAADIPWNTRIPQELYAKSDAGTKMLSVLLNLNFHQPPQTIQAILSVLKDIENGTAAALDIGPQLAAEAQRLGESVVRSMIGDARRAGMEIGILGYGKLNNPYTWTADVEAEIQQLYGQMKTPGSGTAVFRDELGLQYGLKQRPIGHTDPVTGEFKPANPAIDMNRLPAGFAEEILADRFQPWNERLVSVETKQAFSRLFHIDNRQITFEARARFETQLAKYGIPAQAAEKVWTAWRDAAKGTHSVKWARNKITGEMVQRPGDTALYATEKNIPNSELQTIARQALDDYYAKVGGMPAGVRAVDFATEMRVAGSFTRRNLAGLADKLQAASGGPLGGLAAKGVPLADFAANAYGLIAHNWFVTTGYFQFRFGLDARFHAMNKFEGPSLYYGAAGLKTAEVDRGMFGILKSQAENRGEAYLDTGYPFSATRQEWADRYIKKMQPDALRGIVKANPQVVKDAIEGAALRDPQIADMVANMGHTPNEYLTILDRHWTKIMKSADPEAMIDAELMHDLVNNPELEQVYARIAQVNKELIDSSRQVFYGNPARGQAERFLNSYLVYWPLSYQIKAAKWLLNIMYGKIGGIQTGGLGAYAMDQLQAEHEKRLVEDPEYQQWFLDHPTLVFAAQMMLPIAPGGIGVGLNPAINDAFFGGTKNPGIVGPVYTITKFLPQLAGDLYPTVNDLLGAGVADPMMQLTGQKPPAPKKPAPKAPLAP